MTNYNLEEFKNWLIKEFPSEAHVINKKLNFLPQDNWEDAFLTLNGMSKNKEEYLKKWKSEVDQRERERERAK